MGGDERGCLQREGGWGSADSQAGEESAPQAEHCEAGEGSRGFASIPKTYLNGLGWGGWPVETPRGAGGQWPQEDKTTGGAGSERV